MEVLNDLRSKLVPWNKSVFNDIHNRKKRISCTVKTYSEVGAEAAKPLSFDVRS